MSWQVQDAKNRFSEVIEKAIAAGPQIITRHGTETAVVMSIAEFRRLTRPAQSLSQFLRNSPLADIAVDELRDRTPARDVDLE